MLQDNLFHIKLVPPSEAPLESFARLMQTVPPSERHTAEDWMAKIHSQAILCFKAGESYICVEPLEDALGARYLHVVGLEGKGFMSQADGVHEDLSYLARHMGAKYFTWTTANERLALAAARRHGAKRVASIYRLELHP